MVPSAQGRTLPWDEGDQSVRVVGGTVTTDFTPLQGGVPLTGCWGSVAIAVRPLLIASSSRQGSYGGTVHETDDSPRLGRTDIRRTR